MTLNTTLVLHEWTDPIELHSWFNENVLGVADKNPIVRRSETSIHNALGQGFDAIFEVDWEKDRAPLVWFDREAETERMKQHVPSIYTAEEAAAEIEESAAFYAKYPQGVIKIDWDTAYGYSSLGGLRCTELHAVFIVRLACEFLEPRGITFAWKNEYTGEWNEGLTGFEGFVSAGLGAMDWFHSVALPAIVAEATS